MLRQLVTVAAAMFVPAVLAAQALIPANEERASATAKDKAIPAVQASDMAQEKVAEALARRATRVRGSVVGLAHRPAWIASPPAARAVPSDGGGAARPAVPVDRPSLPQRPESPGQSGSRRP